MSDCILTNMHFCAFKRILYDFGRRFSAICFFKESSVIVKEGVQGRELGGVYPCRLGFCCCGRGVA